MSEGINEVQQLIAEFCDEIKDFLIKKNQDYGNSAIEPMRVFSTSNSIEQINVRIDDKLSRIAQSKDKKFIEDTELDLIGYLILKRVAIRYQARSNVRKNPAFTNVKRDHVEIQCP
jgi:hypothetical protein